MLYHVEIQVKLPEGTEPAKLDDLKAREKAASAEYQKSGEWVHLWRIAGRFGNISIFNVANHDRLHEILWSLPLFPYMTINVLPLAQHPSALVQNPL